jgi:hypothetical protein
MSFKRIAVSIAFLLSVSLSFAGDIGLIGPDVAPSAYVVIAAPGGNKRNCITDLTSSSTSQIIIRVLSGTVTTYTVTAASSTVVPEHWHEKAPLCGGVNMPLTIKANLGTSASVIESATFLSYSGLVRE